MVGKNFTVNSGAAFDTLTLMRLEVGGTTTLSLGDGLNTVTIDDSLFAGIFRLTTGRGADFVNLDTQIGTDRATTFNRTVTLSLGAGNDSLTLAGGTDAGQAVVYLSTFIAHHGADVDSVFQTPGKEVHPFGPGLAWVL